MNQKFQQKELTGVLFRNDEPNGEHSPQYLGSVTVGGTKYKLSAWVNEAQDGRKYLSLRLTAPPARAERSAPAHQEPRRAPPDDFDDDIPF